MSSANDLTLLNDFLSPVDSATIEANLALNPYLMGANIQYFDGQELPNIEATRIAIIGVSEQRNVVNNHGTADAPQKVKQEFYQLSAFNDYTKIIDMGEIKAGATPKDTYFGLAKVCSILLKLGMIPVVIGGSNDCAYGHFMAYQEQEQDIHYVHVDARLDLSFLQEDILSNTFLSNVITHKPNFLKHFQLLGYQSYLLDYNLMKVLGQLKFDATRLGALQEDWKEMEPHVRDADLVTIDISAVRASEAPGNGNASPNGFFGDEICAMARYAGMSDRVSSFGIYEINPHLDLRNTTAQLAAQMIWYFIDGVLHRVADYPIINENDFILYHLMMEDTGEQMQFLKSRKSSRWWIKAKLPGSERHKLIPCSYQDYLMATRNELPERFLKGLELL